MDDDQVHEMQTLEGILLDPSAEPIQLSYGLLKYITNNFSKTNKIGSGAFGVVYKGALVNEFVAVKLCLNAVTNKQFVHEIACLKGANHKNVVRFLGYCAEKDEKIVPLEEKFENLNWAMKVNQRRLLCFEYVPEGNIKEYLERDNSPGENWPARYQMIRGICEGLQHLHEKRIHHRDLKPENVMLDARMQAKITDFGLSRFLDEGKSKIVSENNAGTLRYMAPEVKDRNEITFKADMYALGIIILELLTGISLISLLDWDESLDLPDCPRAVRCTEIARKCMDDERDNRPTIHEVIRDLDELEGIATNSSTNLASSRAFSRTELIDASPMVLRFPFEPNQPINRSVALTNETDQDIYYIICPYFSGMCWYCGSVLKRSTKVVELTLHLEAEQESLGENRVLIFIFVGITNDDFLEIESEVTEAIAEGKQWSEAAQKKVIGLGGDMDWATLKVEVCHRGPTQMTPAFSQVQKKDKVLDAIKSIEVHETRPWVLVQLRSGTVHVWNWQIRRIIGTIQGPAGSAKFNSLLDWIVIGDMSGSLHVYTCPEMERIKEFTPRAGSRGHSGPITALAVLPNTSIMMLASYSQVDEVLLFTSWQPRRASLGDPSVDMWECYGSSEDVPPIHQLMYHPSGLRLLSALPVGDEPTLTWDFWEGLRVDVPDRFAGVAMDFLSPNSMNNRYPVALCIQRAYIWDLDNEAVVHYIDKEFSKDTSAITVIACHQTRPLFVMATQAGSITVWDSTTYRLKKEYQNMRKDPIDIVFIGSTRVLIAYEDELSILETDVQ